MRKLLVAAVLLLAIVGVAWSWTRMRLVLFRRVPECTVWESLRDKVQEKRRVATRAAVPRRLVRNEDALQLWAIPKGEFWVDRNGARSVGRMELPTRYGEFEGEPVVRPGDVYLDCGAYIGDTSSEAVRAGASLVVAVEPSPDNLECLRRNLAKDIKAGRVIVYPKGVWDRDEVLHFQHEHSAADKVDETGDISIPVTTIDKIVEELDLKRLDVIKMDIEGAEQKALEGARKTITRFRPRLILGSYHLEADYEKIPELVRQIRSDYTMRCGRCLAAHGRIIPQALYFY